MQIVAPEIDRYIAGAFPVRDELLQEMQEHGESLGFPIIGPQAGRLLSILARSIGARRVLELGSGFGYSAMWFAHALPPDGEIILTDRSEENMDAARRYFERSGLTTRLRFVAGDALGTAKSAAGPFDVILCDMDKASYPAALPLAREKLRLGGYLICDNMLWSGRVASPDDDPGTQAILGLTRELAGAEDFATTILPVRDGVSLSLRLA